MTIVTGHIRKIVGNQMPGPGIGVGKSNAKPLSVPVHVYKGDEITPHSKPGSEHVEEFVKTVKSDKDGKYSVELPQGVYTIVAEIDGKLYLNLQAGRHWHPISVPATGQVTWNIDDTSEAFF